MRIGCRGPLHHLCSRSCHMQIEALEEVERAFVHVDYASRELPEHKVSSSALIIGL